jgi:hypothetical protein
VLMLVRLRAREPDGSTLGERERSCHLVPAPDPGTTPEYLTTYCGRQIAPDSAERLDYMQGTPCEVCLGKSPIPTFAFLRTFVNQIGGRDGAV